jgi:diacylglycerol kinase (ATP)
MDVLILKKCNLAEFVRIVSLALKGEHIHDPHIIHFRTKHMMVSSEGHVQLNLDGEYGGTLPCTFSVLPSHIDIITDASGHSSYKIKGGVNLFR